MPGEDGYTSDAEDEWAALGPRHWDKIKARGADCYGFGLDVREFTSSPGQKIKNRTWARIDNMEKRFDEDSILFADYFWHLDGMAQVLLDEESRKKRYEINDDDQNDWSNPDHKELSGRLQTLWVTISFRHPPFGVHLPHLAAQKRARDANA